MSNHTSPNFADRLMALIADKNSRVCVGIDPRLDLLPGAHEPPPDQASAVQRVLEFCIEIIRRVAPYVVAVKFQAAFFERLGMVGWMLYFELARAARRRGLITIADVKRGDIGSTAQAYADALLADQPDPAFDAVTLNPYFGSDSARPFVALAARGARGVFVVVRASNPSAAELQDLQLSDGRLVHEAVADLVVQWGEGLVGASGYSAVGAVVGATVPEHLARLRQRLAAQPLLVPGYGAQGAGPEDVVHAFDDRGLGAVVNSSRGIIYAYTQEPYATEFGEAHFSEAAAAAARTMRDDINAALRSAGKLS